MTEPGNRVVFEFVDSDTAARFLGWMSDGGGEQMFFESEEHHGGEVAVIRMNYSKAFPAWGYNPEEHGPDRVVEAQSKREEG